MNCMHIWCGFIMRIHLKAACNYDALKCSASENFLAEIQLTHSIWMKSKCLCGNGLFMLNMVSCCLSFSHRIHSFICSFVLHFNAVSTQNLLPNIELLIKLKVYRCQWLSALYATNVKHSIRMLTYQCVW